MGTFTHFFKSSWRVTFKSTAPQNFAKLSLDNYSSYWFVSGHQNPILLNN